MGFKRALLVAINPSLQAALGTLGRELLVLGSGCQQVDVAELVNPCKAGRSSSQRTSDLKDKIARWHPAEWKKGTESKDSITGKYMQDFL